MAAMKRAVQHSSPKPTAVVLNYPNNPTAKTVDLDFYEEVVDFCLHHGIYILSDIAYVEIYFDIPPPPSILEDPIGAVQRQFQRGPVAEGPRADAYLTPAALGALTRGEGRSAALRSEAESAEAEPPSGGPLPRPVYWGMDRARMAVPGDSGDETVFTFARTGFFSWHLVHVSLPEERLPMVGQSGRKGG